jgi:hypothetical protein
VLVIPFRTVLGPLLFISSNMAAPLSGRRSWPSPHPPPLHPPRRPAPQPFARTHVIASSFNLRCKNAVSCSSCSPTSAITSAQHRRRSAKMGARARRRCLQPTWLSGSCNMRRRVPSAPDYCMRNRPLPTVQGLGRRVCAAAGPCAPYRAGAAAPCIPCAALCATAQDHLAMLPCD